jgi:hypothetical protein
MYKVLLALHVVAGNVALLSAPGAVIVEKVGRAHAWIGRAFAIGMTVIFLTAVPMTVLKPNLFLFLVALFNFYMVSTGWLRATNRKGSPTRLEWAIAIGMVLAAIGMAGRSVMMLAAGHSMGIVLLVFALIGGALSLRDVVGLRQQKFRGTERIASHLTRMLGGTIGAVTAFIVTNVRLEPAFVLWLLPSVALTPLVIYWTRRVRRPVRRESSERGYATTPVRS